MRSHSRGHVARKLLIDPRWGILGQHRNALLDRSPWRIWTAEDGDRPRVLFNHHFGTGTNSGQEPGKIAGSLSFGYVERCHIQNDTSIWNQPSGEAPYSPVCPAGRVFQRR